MTVRVLIADDQPLVRRGLRTVLSAAEGIEVVGEAADGLEAIALVERRHPDVVLMDVRMPRLDGLAATRRIVAAGRPARPDVLVLTTFDDDASVFGALRAGAAGFLLKDAEPDALLDAIHRVAAGHGLIAPAVTRRLIAEFARSDLPRPDGDARLASLTAREHEVLLLVARGLSNAELAAELVLEESTVKGHVAKVLAKLGLRSRAQAVVVAYESGLVRPGARTST